MIWQWLRRGDVRLLGVARIALGLVFFIRTTALANLLPIPLAHVRGVLYGWPAPGLAMAWGDLVIPPSFQAGACIVRTIAVVLFTLGVRARVTGLVAGLLGLLAMSQDPFFFIFTLYTMFVGTIVLALTDATALVALRPDRPFDARSSATFVPVIIAIVYAWSAVAKLQREWLSGDTLLALAQDRLLTPLANGLLRAHSTLRLLAAWGAALGEAGLAVGLLVPRTRRAAVVAACIMHVVFELGAHPDVMTGVMLALLLGCAVRISGMGPLSDRVTSASPQ